MQPRGILPSREKSAVYTFTEDSGQPWSTRGEAVTGVLPSRPGEGASSHVGTGLQPPTFLAVFLIFLPSSLPPRCPRMLPGFRIFEAAASLPAWVLPKAETDRGFSESKVASWGADRCPAMIPFLI